jgi:hypothetical protein
VLVIQYVHATTTDHTPAVCDAVYTANALHSQQQQEQAAADTLAADDMFNNVHDDMADDVADDASDDDAPASSSPSVLQTLTKQLHASAFLAIFNDWQHLAHGASTVTLQTVRTDLLKVARRFSYNRGGSSSSSRSSSVALVNFVLLTLTNLVRSWRVTFETARLQDSARIITAWQGSVAACSERARQKLQQVRGTLPSYYYYSYYFEFSSTCSSSDTVGCVYVCTCARAYSIPL